ncbi:hypothetical protein K438DRAFT_895670 [Mycena galopus ATCC 62051]|nr:hypothetical protein K438DRAFT_895670 [Mycena galopus ATCC 62051]
MERTNKATCARCRAKKIRCDGQQPCGPCSKGRVDSANCNYTAPAMYHGPELRKGAACSACRRKKKKCSGDWPCRTCIVSKKEDDCKYDDGSQLSYTRALIERTRELEQLLSQAEAKQAPPNTSSYPAIAPELSAELDQLLSSNAFATPEPVLFDRDPFLDNLGLEPFTPDEDSSDVFENPVMQAEASGSIRQVESLEEKLLRLRNMFLVRRAQLGFILPAHKLNALVAGDLTGTIVHPVLVHVCHLWGYMLDYYLQNHTWTYAPDKNGDEVAQMRLILGSLRGMLGHPPDPLTSLMAYLSLSLYFYHKDDFGRGQEFLTVAGDLAFKHDLDLAALANIPIDVDDTGTYSIIPVDDAGELRSSFSHLIYTAMAAEVVLKSPPFIDVRLLDKFDLLMDTQVTKDADTNFLRGKSLRLLTKTRKLTTTWNNCRSPPPSWFKQYWSLIEKLHAHVGILNLTQLRISFIPDAHLTGLVLKIASTIALTALADLHGIFTPSHIESSRRYRDTVVEIVGVSSTFSVADCPYLDPILPICWSVATKRILTNQVVYENQESIMAAIRACNQNLQQVLPYVGDFEASNAPMLGLM